MREVNNLFGKYLSDSISGLSNEDDLYSYDTYDDIIDYLTSQRKKQKNEKYESNEDKIERERREKVALRNKKIDDIIGE